MMSFASMSRLLRRPATLVGLVVITGCAVLVPLSLDFVNEPGAVEVAPAAVPLAAKARSVRASGRPECDSCGVVESITRFEPDGAQAASYEFTVRLRDGSARVSSLPSASSWRVGDNIMLMGGGDKSAGK